MDFFVNMTCKNFTLIHLKFCGFNYKGSFEKMEFTLNKFKIMLNRRVCKFNIVAAFSVKSLNTFMIFMHQTRRTSPLTGLQFVADPHTHAHTRI